MLPETSISSTPVPQQSDDPAVYNTRRVSSAVYSQILRMSECVIASQALDHTLFCKNCSDCTRAMGIDLQIMQRYPQQMPYRLPCSVCLDRKSSLSLPQAVETLIRFAALSMHSFRVYQEQLIGVEGAWKEG